MRKKLKYIIIPFGVIATLLISYQFYASTHPLGAVYFSTTHENITLDGINLLRNLDISLKGYSPSIQLRQNESLIRQIQSEFGLAEGNAILRDQYPGYYWDLRWIQENNIFFQQENGEENTPEQKAKNGWEDLKKLQLRYDTKGNVIYFSREIPDSVILPAILNSNPRIAVLSFINQYTAFTEDDLKLSQTDTTKDIARIHIQESEGTEPRGASQRTDYEFQWQLNDSTLINKAKIIASVRGNIISKVEVDYNVPEKYDGETAEIIFVILIMIFVISVTILTIVLAFKKSRAYEINFRIAIYLGITIAVLFAGEYLLMLSRTSGWEIVLSIIVVPAFWAGIFIITWAVSESLGREVWKEKFIPLDLVMKGHFIHSRIGKGILWGLLAGSFAFLVSLFVTWGGMQFIDITAVIRSDTVFEYFSTFNPALLLLSHNLWAILFVLAVNCILLITYIYSRTNNRTLTYILAVIPLTLMTGSKIEPIYFGLIFDSIAMLLVIWVFFKSDILTTYITLFTYAVANVALGFMQSDPGIFSGSLTILMTVFFGLIGYAFFAIFTRDSVHDFSDIEPAIARFISERQRMQQQLEVARQVQMSFLPRKMPGIKGLDVAAKCLPAFEVGGDYFDFVQLNQRRLGVAIGDVSGKGTKAAFYMTLLKGFLRALARSSQSPAKILKEINTLFYENASRDAFISMIYGVFDLDARELIMARSGHNPVLLHRTQKNSIDTIVSDGMALGLDRGPLFDEKMQEKSVPFMTGDVFIFYTDGVTEARNKHNEEFGEERLEKAVMTYAPGHANAILDGIYKEVQKFKKKAELEDDMTMVVVKIL